MRASNGHHKVRRIRRSPVTARPVWCHISEVAPVFVKEIRDFVTEGQTVKVKIIGINEDGKISLSMKKADENAAAAAPPAPPR